MNKKGFTLVELIASITIIGLLTVLMIPVVQDSSVRVKQSNYEALKKMIIEATINYFNNSSDPRLSLDAIKPSNVDCMYAEGEAPECVQTFELGKDILDNNIYYTDQKDHEEKLTVFNPTNGLSMRKRHIYIYYDVETYTLKGDFIEGDTIE